MGNLNDSDPNNDLRQSLENADSYFKTNQKTDELPTQEDVNRMLDGNTIAADEPYQNTIVHQINS